MISELMGLSLFFIARETELRRTTTERLCREGATTLSSTMPQNEHMELHKKRHGVRMDHEERM